MRLAGRSDGGTMAAMWVAIAIWSTTFAAITAALQHFSPAHLLVTRWTMTSLVLIVVAVLTRMPLPAKRDIPQIAAAGLLGVGAYQLLLVNGQAGISATMAGFLVNLSPMFTTVMAIALRKESSSRAIWSGIALCTIGLAMMGSAAGGWGRIGWSAGLVVASALCFALSTLATKPLLSKYSPLRVTVYSTLAGSLPFLVFAPGAWRAVSTAPSQVLATVVLLAVFHGGIAFVLWARALDGMTAAVAARFLYLIPVLGVGVSWAWLAEAPAPLTLAGGLLTIVGVAVSSVRGVTPLRPAARQAMADTSPAAALADAA